jgi:hypothetical protein
MCSWERLWQGLKYETVYLHSPPPHDFPGHIWGILPPALREVFMAKSKTERGRFSSRKKMDVVLRVLRGDDLDLVSRERASLPRRCRRGGTSSWPVARPG